MGFLFDTSAGMFPLALSASCALLPLTAAAQDVTPTPAPTRPPIITTLPGVTPERFTLGSPTPTPVPVPPTVNPTPTPTPVPRVAAPAPRPAPAATAPLTSPTPIPTANPSPVATQSSTPEVLPVPLATAAPGFEAVPAPAPAPAPSGSPWLWLLAGAAGSAIIIGGAWALLARRRRVTEVVAEDAPVAALPPEPSPGPPARLAPPPPVPAASDEPFDIQLRPLGLQVDNDGATLEVDVLIANLQPGSAENIRLAPAMMSAQPEQDRYVAAFHANPIFDTAAQAFDLAVGTGGRVPVRLRLARDHLHVVETGGRPMFVPMVMIDIRWRAGLSLRRFGADFMVGTAGRSDKVGPIWLDRPQLSGELAATRYIPRS